MVRHDCDNAKCVNPDHLQLGTQLENMRDASDRDRLWHRAGEKNLQATITAQTALAIYKDTGGYTALARKYGTTKIIVARIKTHKNWTSVTRPQP